MTNRDVYLAIGALTGDRDLEEYLRALLPGIRAHREAEGLTGEQFTALITAAFTSAALPYDPAWEQSYDTRPESGFAAVGARLMRHIVDLREMRAVGKLSDPQRYFGVDAPRGARWYNFDPKSYLECGAAGSIGGWEPGDATGRNFVPGEVAILGPEGLVSADPRELERPVIAADLLTWEALDDFFLCGQSYE